ncbi:hypothetical protein [Luteibacter aegosomatissinici]|uniref:hypothetical protein n=1 Tax=Luteibacter aegosomatissinici TaxID=2911539 RepID=UPI001FF7A022|nr:hypothetical protein [Luteibacter aegosomatissinici]UPG95049.1 hypothetical protein L2Y97_02775 [Luteibacter aegosomatissinici]
MKRFASLGKATARVGAIVAMLVFAAAVQAADQRASAPTPELTRVGSMSTQAKPSGVPDDYVVTPNGYFSPDCVATIHQGDELQASGLIRRASGVSEKAPACGKANFSLQGERIEPNGRRSLTATPPPEQSGWVQAANYSSSKPIGRIVATWTVPTAPSTKDDQVIYFFPGLEQLPTVQSILQPVLGWNGYGDKAWTLASWNCCVDGTTFHSDPVAAKAGDVVVGDTYSTCAAGQACSTWKIDSRNTTTGQTSSLTTNPYADLTWVFGGVLEVYNVSTCGEYPGGPITFRNIQVYDRNNTRVSNPPWQGSDTSGIDPQCNYGLSTTATSATISY